jgi:hypothetical protein
MLGNKSRSVRIETSPDLDTAIFKKDGNGIIFLMPPGQTLENGTSLPPRPQAKGYN